MAVFFEKTTGRYGIARLSTDIISDLEEIVDRLDKDDIKVLSIVPTPTRDDSSRIMVFYKKDQKIDVSDIIDIECNKGT